MVYTAERTLPDIISPALHTIHYCLAIAVTLNFEDRKIGTLLYTFWFIVNCCECGKVGKMGQWAQGAVKEMCVGVSR